MKKKGLTVVGIVAEIPVRCCRYGNCLSGSKFITVIERPVKRGRPLDRHVPSRQCTCVISRRRFSGIRPADQYEGMPGILVRRKRVVVVVITEIQQWFRQVQFVRFCFASVNRQHRLRRFQRPHRRLPNHLSSAGPGHELGTHRREAAPPAARRRCSEDRVRDIRPIALHANEAAPPQARAPRPEQTPKRRGVSSPTDCSPWPCQSFVLASDERPSRQSGLCARLGARGRCPAAHRPTSNAYDSPLGSGTSNALRVNDTSV